MVRQLEKDSHWTGCSTHSAASEIRPGVKSLVSHSACFVLDEGDNRLAAILISPASAVGSPKSRLPKAPSAPEYDHPSEPTVPSSRQRGLCSHPARPRTNAISESSWLFDVRLIRFLVSVLPGTLPMTEFYDLLPGFSTESSVRYITCRPRISSA